ncbi:MAG: amidase family protein [Chloroflexi bacterium]|nr:amidase family protein [Chloroflexota bacterium]
MSNELWQLDATDLAALIRAGHVSAVEAVESHLKRLDAVNPKLNAVVRVLADEARAEANRADARLRAGEPVGPLHGVPVTTKINVDQIGCPTDNGIVMFKDLIAESDSPPVASLRRAGAIFIGRTNSPAFAMRAFTDNALHGLTLNPHNKDYTCGGSSGGAGASIAVGIGAIGQGNDIGGSVRWPAYCNGIVGLRPTPGRIAAGNMSATSDRLFGSQLMSVQGPLARSVRDVRLALGVMSVRDARDPLWVPAPLEGEPLARPIRVALVTNPDGIALQPAVVEAVRRAGRYLAAAGYRVEEVSPPELLRVSELWHPLGLPGLNLTLRPALKQLADPGLETFINAWLAMRPASNEVASLLNAMGERDTLIRKWQIFMETYAIIVMPACGEVALPVGTDTNGMDGARRTLEALRFQLMLPVLGLPGLAMPTGSHDGLPLGVQIVTRRFREDIALAAGEVIEAHEGVRRPIGPKF